MKVYINNKLDWLFKNANIYIILIMIIWSFRGIDFELSKIYQGIPNAYDFVKRMFPPDFSDLNLYISAVIETTQIAIFGTFLASILAFPLSFLGSRNINSNLLLYNLVRLIFDACRGISEVIWGLLCVSVIGLGPSAGVLALAIHNFGALGRYFSETVENVPSALLDASKSAGASKIQIVSRVIFPEVKHRFVGFIFYYFEHGLRAATILGLVGAGGVGFLLETRISLFRYREASAILIIILLVIVGADRLSALIRLKALNIRSFVP